MVCFLFITPLATISGWLCLRGAVDHLHFSSRLEAVGLIALTVALFTIYLFWTLVSMTRDHGVGGSGWQHCHHWLPHICNTSHLPKWRQTSQCWQGTHVVWRHWGGGENMNENAHTNKPQGRSHQIEESQVPSPHHTCPVRSSPGDWDSNWCKAWGLLSCCFLLLLGSLMVGYEWLSMQPSAEIMNPACCLLPSCTLTWPKSLLDMALPDHYSVCWDIDSAAHKSTNLSS